MQVSPPERIRCPRCNHHDDKHLICRECGQELHALCLGRVPHQKNPLKTLPCHCAWNPEDRDADQ